jgi:hypothetical protein
MVVNKTIYGNNGDNPDKLLNMFLSVVQESEII